MKLLRKVRESPFGFILRRFLSSILLETYLVWGDESRLKIAPTANVTNTFFNLYSGRIVIEDYVLCGHNVCIITGKHDYEKTGFERVQSIPQVGRDVTVKKGAWIGSNVTILGPCTIGENSVIAAGCLINRDVPPDTICFPGNSLVLKEIKYKEKEKGEI